MKKYRCGECERCAHTPNDGNEYDGYCMEMEIIVDVRDEACSMARIVKEKEEEYDEEGVH
jgi:hypothetical protein